jgi:CheY-like chemotaxis protein
MNLSGKRIIIVDDDVNFRNLIRKLLEGQGFIIEESPDLLTTYAMIKERTPDLILLDLEISATEHGSDFLAKRQNDPFLSLIPTIVCSANSRQDIVRKMIGLGVNDYIIKPTRPDWLIRKIKKVLKAQATYEYKFKDDELTEQIEVDCWGELISLGEANCIVRSPVNFARHEESKINFIAMQNNLSDGERFKPHQFCRSNSYSRPSMSGVYDTLFTMVGISEREASSIRRMKAGWRGKT